MGLNDFLYGTPPQTGIYQAPSMRSPLHGFGRAMSDYLTSLIGAAPPTYQGRLDPGMSPTMQMLAQMLQGRAMRVPQAVAGAANGLPGGYQAAFRPPPAFDPASMYQFAFRPPQWQPGAGGGGGGFGSVPRPPRPSNPWQMGPPPMQRPMPMPMPMQQQNIDPVALMIGGGG